MQQYYLNTILSSFKR